jgi:Xaa-Pro aminopeptidase
MRDAERHDRLAQALRDAQLDALVCRLPENVLLLSGYWPMSGFSFVVYRADGTATLIVPSVEQEECSETWISDRKFFDWARLGAPDPYERIGAHLRQACAGMSRIGVERSFEAVAPPTNAGEPAVPADVTWAMIESATGGTALVDATDPLMDQRAVKTAAELKRLAVANEVAGLGLERFAETLEPGRTDADMVAAVEAAIVSEGTRLEGVSRVRAFAQVSSGPDTAQAWRPCVISGDRVIREGELVVLELGVVVDGFWADNTRTRVAGGAASDQQLEWYSIVQEAQEAAISMCQAGVTCAEVDRAARSVIERHELGEYFVHITGHGIGWRYHEPVPFVAPGNPAALEVGHVHSVEPGLYKASFGGMRVEDIVAERSDGNRVLSTAQRSLV